MGNSRFFRSIFAALSITLITACDSSSKRNNTPKEPKNEAPDFVAALHNPLAICPARIWPNAQNTLAEAQVLVTGLDPEWAYLWQANHGEPQITSVRASALRVEWFASFNRGDFQNRRTLGFNASAWGLATQPVDGTWMKSVLPILLHEAFHEFLQDDFVHSGIGRAQEYPIVWQPRHARAELLQALERSLKQGEPLGAAAYWWERYLAVALNEAMAISGTDRNEGSANYAEFVATALADLQCNVSEMVLLDHIIEHLPAAGVLDHEAASESYELGTFAGLLLRQSSIADWEQRVARGETLVEILLENVLSVEQADDAALRTQLQTDIQLQNERIAEYLGDSVETILDPNNIRLVLPYEGMQGSFSTLGFYLLSNNPSLGTATLQMEALYDFGSEVEISSVNAFDFDGDHPCEGFSSDVISLEDERLTETANGNYSYTSATAQFTNLAADVLEYGGYQWLCPTNVDAF